MGLRIRRVSSIRVQIVTVTVGMLALVAQPLYGFASAQVAHAISVDVAPPVISDVHVTPMTDDKFVAGNVTVTFKLSDASDIDLSKGRTHVRFMNGKDVNGEPVASDPYGVAPVAGENNAYSAVVKTRDFVPEGTLASSFRVYVRAEDTEGNETAAAFYKNQITVDNDKPVAQITNPAFMETWGGETKKTLLIHGTASDGNLTQYNYYVRDSNNKVVGNNGWSKKETASVENGQLGTWDLDGLPSGEYMVGLMAYDKTGDANKTYDSQKFIIDNDKPSSTSDLAATVGGSVTIRQTVTDAYTPASGKLRIWKLDSEGKQDNDKFYASGQLPVDGDGVVTYSLNTKDDLFGDGDYIAKFSSWDTVGNANVDEVRFSVDNTAPVATLQLTSTPTPTADTPVSFAGKVEDAASLASLKLYRGSEEIADMTDDARDDGKWSYTLEQGLTKGKYDFSLIATDVFGNASTVALASQLSVGPYAVPSSLKAVGGGAALVAPLPTPELVSPQALAATRPVVTTPVIAPETSERQGDVLGTETTSGDAAAASESMPVIAPSESGWKLFGLAWYWWLLIAAAIAGAVSGMNLLRRRKQMA